MGRLIPVRRSGGTEAARVALTPNIDKLALVAGLLFTMLALLCAIPASATAAVQSDPFTSATNHDPDLGIHENPAQDYLVGACDGDTDNAMSFSAGGMPVSDDASLMADFGEINTNGCLTGGLWNGMSIGGTNGSTNGGANTGVNGDFSLTAPAHVAITGLSYTDYNFATNRGTGIISGWFGELAGNSDSQGLAADHDPTQTYSSFKGNVTPGDDCVTSTPAACQVSNNTNTVTKVFNANPWTTATTAAPALQKIAFGFECRAATCDYGSAEVWANVGPSVFQLDDPVTAPGAGSGSGGTAAFAGQGASAGGGWETAAQVGASTFTTATDPAGICTLAVGLYNSSGNPVDVDQDSSLQTPSEDSEGYYNSATPCSDAGSPASFAYTPNEATLAALPSGTYYLNAVASDPAEYQQGVYSWYAGGTSNSAITAAGEGIPVKIDNTQPLVTITSGVSGVSNNTMTETVNVTATTGPSGISSLSCTDDATAITPTSTTTGSDTRTNTYTLSGSGTHTVACQVTNGVGVNATNSASIDVASLTQYGSSPEIDSGNNPYSNGPSETTWYRGSESVTVTADKSSGSNITAIDCTGAGLNASYPNTNSSLDEQVTVNVQPPGGTLRCTASDAAGDMYPLGSYTFLLDDTAPTGTFVGEDPSDPALVRVAAADSGSGIAGVEITFTCQSGPCLTANGNGGPFPMQSETTKLDGSDGYWEAVIPDTGAWPNGDYSLSATITDNAGNTADVGTFADGTDAGISLPARAVTTIMAVIEGDGRAAAASTTALTPGATQTSPALRRLARTQATSESVCTVKVRTIRKAAGKRLARTKLERKCSPGLPKAKEGPITVTYGTRALIRGRLLAREGNIPLKHVAVLVWARAVTSARRVRIGDTRTNRRGYFSYHVKPGPSRVITIAYDGTEKLHPVAATIRERVYGVATIHLRGRLIAGHVVTLVGRVKGAQLPAGGVLVQPRDKLADEGSGWAPFGNAVRTNRRGDFKIRLHVARVVKGLRFEVDVRVANQTGYAYVTATSHAITQRVR